MVKVNNVNHFITFWVMSSKMKILKERMAFFKMAKSGKPVINIASLIINYNLINKPRIYF